MYDWMKLILTKSWLGLQEFLIEVGHEADGISRNGDFDTPLHVAVEFSEAVAKLLAKRFPRCITFRNKKGADPVRLAANHFAPPSPFFILFYFLKKPPPPPQQFVFVLSSVYMRPSFSLSSSEIFCYFEVKAGGKRKKRKKINPFQGTKKQADHAGLQNTQCLTPSYSHIPLSRSTASVQSTPTSSSPGSRHGRKYSASLRLCLWTVEMHSGFAGGRSGPGDDKWLELDSG